MRLLRAAGDVCENGTGLINDGRSQMIKLGLWWSWWWGGEVYKYDKLISINLLASQERVQGLDYHSRDSIAGFFGVFFCTLCQAAG